MSILQLILLSVIVYFILNWSTVVAFGDEEGRFTSKVPQFIGLVIFGFSGPILFVLCTFVLCELTRKTL